MQIKETWVNKLAESAHLFLYNVTEWMERYRALREKPSEDTNREIDKMLNAINSAFINLQMITKNLIRRKYSIKWKI